MERRNDKKLIVALSILMLAVAFFVGATVVPKYAQYVWQARAFLNGRLDITDQVLRHGVLLDAAPYEGKYFWPLGPLPSLIFLPFVAFSPDSAVIQVIYHLLAVFGIFFLALGLARRCGAGRTDAWWLAFAFCFSSVMVGPLLQDDYCPVAQVTVALLLLAAVFEYKGRNRPWLVGILTSLALATRLTAGLAILFFLVMAWSADRAPKDKMRRLSALLLPMMIVLAGLAWFNYARFDDAMNSGYALQILSPHALPAGVAPVWGPNLHNFARNAYYYFLRLPEWRSGRLFVDPLGLSLFLVMPVFLWLAAERRPSKEWLTALGVSGATLLVLLSLPYSGYAQIGPRYVNDFLPLLYLMLSLSFAKRGIGPWPKAVIVGSAALNFIFFLASLSWPQFGVL